MQRSTSNNPQGADHADETYRSRKATKSQKKVLFYAWSFLDSFGSISCAKHSTSFYWEIPRTICNNDHICVSFL